MVELAQTDVGGNTAPVMLTGDQIAAARKLAGIKTQADLAELAKVSEPAIARAEAVRGVIPGMQTGNMEKIVKALEAAGVEFYLEAGASLAGGVGMRLKPHPGGPGVRLKKGEGE